MAHLKKKRILLCKAGMIMGGDSCVKVREFESRYHILDGHFSHLFVVKHVMCVRKDEINEKEAEVGPFKKGFSFAGTDTVKL